MPSQRKPEDITQKAANLADQPLNRRRALRLLGTLAAAAGAAALVASRTEPASADGTEGPTAFNGPISATSSTIAAAVTGTGSGAGNGVSGSGYNFGVSGMSTGSGGSSGVLGISNTPEGLGVQGRSNTATGTGVWGDSTEPNGMGGPGVYGSYTTASGTGGGFGVVGSSTGGTGVFGSTTSPSNGPAAVLGINNGAGVSVAGSGTGGGIGVSGSTTSSAASGVPAVQGVNGGTGPGVVGFSSAGTGVGGGSGSGIGFGGISTSGSGVQGQSTTGSAILGLSTGSGLAGDFRGSVKITGTLTLMGMKSAAVHGKDGTLVRLYCMESPESWFEDFGSGQLSNGKVTVDLEPGFGAVVKTDSYHVFLTAHGETNGLHVTDRTPNSFTVHEGHGGTSNVSFSYRIVAKRKDIAGNRLEHVDELPPVQPLTLPEFPSTPPTLPTLPTRPPRPAH
jgi:hypothetical protein